MKNLLNFKRLLSYSHEKQKPQRFGRYAVMLLMLLTLGVGQMWAKYYAIGDFTGWDHTASQEMTQVGSSNTYYKVVSNVSASTYGFRVDEGNWENTHGWSQKASSDFTWNAGANDNNISITISSTTTLTIWFNSNGNKIWVTSGGYATQTMYVIGSNSWTDSNVKAHVWDSDAPHFAWASDEQMTKESTISRANITYKVYSYTVPKIYTSVKFRYESSETGNLAYNSSTPYYSIELSAWFATTADALAKYLVGTNWTDANWDYSDADNIMTDNGDGSYSKNVSITDATKEIKLKVSKKGTWTGAWGGDAAGTGHNLSVDFGKDKDGNLTFKVTHAGTTKITLTSTGKINVDAPYQVSYAAGTGATGTVSASSVTTYGSTCSLSSSTFTKTYYTQDGWATSDGGDKAYNLGATYTGGYVDVTLYPHWTKTTYSITLNDDGDYDGDGSATVQYGDASLTVSSHAERDGWNLLGYWNSSAAQVSDASGNLIAGVTDYTNSDGEWIYDGDVTLYAHWSQTNSLTVSAGSHIASTSGTTSPVTLNTKYAISATADDGYSFSGWTASPSDNGVFDDASAASTNVTVKNGSVTVTGAATENMTTVTVNVSPAGAGTLTKGGAAFTPGNTVSVGVTTGYSMVATANSGYIFRDWTKTGNAAGTPSTNTFPLNGNGSSGTGTLTANFGIASGWYMYGNAPWGNTWTPSEATAQLTYPYRGMSGVYYIPTTIDKNKYFRITDKSTAYNFSSNTGADLALTKGTIYTLAENSTKATYSTSNLGSVWVVMNTNGTKKAWVQSAQTFYNVNVSGADNDKGPVKVTLKTTSAFTKGDNVFETTQYASGETFTVTVTGVSGYIPTITIGGTPTTWWKEQATYTADGTMSSADVAVTISYTPTRAVRFAKTTGCETLTATGPSSIAVEDNTKIKDGTSITFHQENSTGYTFSKWYSNNTGTSGTSYSTSSSDYALTVSSTAYTIYPIYDEDMHDVTVNAQTGGTVSYNGGAASSSCTARAGIATASASIVATASTGYYFAGWSLPDGTITKASESTYNGATSTYTINATADSKTVNALFNVRYALLGSTDASDDVTAGMPGWGESKEAPFTYSAGTYTKTVDLTVPNVNYKFRIVDRRASSHISYGLSSKAVIQADGDYHDLASINADAQLATAGVGTYTLTVQTNASGYPKVKITNPASQRITMGILTQTDGATSAYTGGTIYAEDELDNEITNGLYIRSGDDITFTATPKAGYIWHGWYDNAACDGGLVTTGRTFTDEDVTSDITRYALFEEALYTVTVHLTDATEVTRKVGVDTHPEITAGAAPTGKVFDRWVTTGSATVADAYASTTTINGASDNASTVTATFKELPKIYIDLTSATGWNPSNMYVVFYKSGGYFDGTNGTGLSSTYVINATPLEMTKMGTSKIWYYAYDPTSGDFEGQTITCVAFVDHWFAANYGNFTSATVVYRTDFSSCMNMFVVTDDTGTNKNKTCYYRNTNAISDDAAKGYWRKYEEKNSGFYLNNLPGGSVEFTNEDGGNSYTAVANLDANTDYYFYLGGCNGWNWSNNSQIFNSDNRSRDLTPYGDVSKDNLRCHLKTTAAGYYTFTLTPLNSGRKVQVAVDFPVAANDYRAVYNNAASSPTVSRPSNIIKDAENSGTISLWLNKGTNYISFQKAAVAVGGAVSWSACGSQQTVSDVPEAGIYTMTLTRSGGTYTVSTPEAYTGDLYIRTDCAPGNWADYTENKLTENTFNFDPDDDDTYDYYYCKWINDAGTNVRCVIANDINVAISDTLKTEAILGGGETLPEGANVRFSYNSLTNTLKRSYLTGASTDVFLNIIPDNAAEVYKTDGTTDMYGSAAAKNKFSDLGNWVYEMDVKVYPGATASVQANYNSTQQPLIAAGTTLLGGTEDKLYQIRLIYDFRTNNLMSAWMPSGTIDEAITLNSDMMIVRRAQNQANKLSFDDGGKLDKVKRAYGVFEFNKAEMVSHMAIWNEDTYKLCMYYFSLPFDVNVADIFGVGTMGDDWRIQFYNGTKRAAKGWFAGDGTTTFWEDVPADTVLHAYEGYCLMLNRSHFNNGSHAVWTNVTTNAYLYFPSVAPVAALKDNTMEITVPSHECKIDRFFDQDKAAYYDEETKTWSKGARNHKYVDSHWNLMGTPLFEDATADALTACKVTIGDADSTLTYIYEWVPSTNSLSARQVLNTDFTFKPMYAYMVQYSGKVTFTGASITPASIAARRTSENKQYTIDLLLTKEDQFAGRTYVELRENAVDSFMLNEDMYMMKGSKIGDIYTHADGYELAANVLSVNSHIVPVSIDAKAAGTYSISMPSNFSGTVTLIDKYAQTRTNLGQEDYEIYLEKGTISDRFELEINISKVPTAIDGVDEGSLKDGKAHKFIMNGVMYILENGRIFDARGNRVK